MRLLCIAERTPKLSENVWCVERRSRDRPACSLVSTAWIPTRGGSYLDGWMDGWMDGWIAMVAYYACHVTPLCMCVPGSSFSRSKTWGPKPLASLIFNRRAEQSCNPRPSLLPWLSLACRHPVQPIELNFATSDSDPKTEIPILMRMD